MEKVTGGDRKENPGSDWNFQMLFLLFFYKIRWKQYIETMLK